MSEILAKLARLSRRDDLPRSDGSNDEEKRALIKLRAEAKDRGATLATGGKGGLPSSIVLGRMRRDKYQCKVCGTSKNLSIHHKGGIVGSKWLSRKGHHLDFDNLVTICPSCHDKLHNKAREDGVDSSQITPEGDKGTRRDHGLPDAKPSH